MDNRVDGIERRVERVEDDQADLRKEVGSLKDRMHTIHTDLVKNNALTENIRDSVNRIESATSASFNRIENHTKESLNDLKSSVRDAVDIATAAKVMGSRPIWGVVTGIIAGVIIVLIALFTYLRGG